MEIMQTKLWLIIASVALFIVGFAIPVIWQQFVQAESATEITAPIASPSPELSNEEFEFSLGPPAQSLTGHLTPDGDVEVFQRDAEEYATFSAQLDVVQGETIRTLDNSQATLSFPDFAELNLGTTTQLTLSNLIPERFLLWLRGGNLEVEMPPAGNDSVMLNSFQQQNVLAVRVLHNLIEFTNAVGAINIDSDIVTVRVTAGTAEIGYVDLENDTQVYQLEAGQSAVINDTRRTIRIN